MPALYPAFLKLDGLRVVVVGGGPVAAGKLDGLVAANACVIVIAPAICDAIRERPDVTIARDTRPHLGWLGLMGPVPISAGPDASIARDASIALGDAPSATDDSPRTVQALDVSRGRIVLVERAFAPPDLDGARWVVAAAPSDVNQQVAAAATARGLFVNAVDDTSAATAYLGGVVRRGEVEVAISTGGTAPALAGLLREALDALLPHDLERWVDVAKRVRAEWKRDRIPMVARRPRLLRALVQIYAARTEPRVHIGEFP